MMMMMMTTIRQYSGDDAVNCRTEDDRRRTAGSGTATSRRVHSVGVRAVHLRADRSADLPGHAQAEVHSHSRGQRRLVSQSDAGRRRATEERFARCRTAKLHGKSRFDDRLMTTTVSENSFFRFSLVTVTAFTMSFYFVTIGAVIHTVDRNCK